MHKKRYAITEFADRLILLDSRPAYKIAAEAGFHYTELSRLRHGLDTVKDRENPRIKRLAETLKIPVNELIEERGLHNVKYEIGNG